MRHVVSALAAALGSFFHPRMLILVIWPLLVATVLWLGVAIFFWGGWVSSLTGMLQSTSMQQWLEQGFMAVAAHYLIGILLALLLFPVIYMTALLITATFGMPAMVNHVAKKHYPELEVKKGGSFTGSLWNALIATFVYCAGWVITLPLWLISPFALVLPIALMAYLNQRLFRYDALYEHASGEEYGLLIGRISGRLYLLGAISGLLQLIPLVGFLLPVYVGLAFTHLCLSELKALRAGAVS